MNITMYWFNQMNLYVKNHINLNVWSRPVEITSMGLLVTVNKVNTVNEAQKGIIYDPLFRYETPAIQFNASYLCCLEYKWGSCFAVMFFLFGLVVVFCLS